MTMLEDDGLSAAIANANQLGSAIQSPLPQGQSAQNSRHRKLIHREFAHLCGADVNHISHWQNKDLAIANLPR